MKYFLFISLLFFSFFSISYADTDFELDCKNTVPIILLLGQSNMFGSGEYGFSDDSPRGPYDDVGIWSNAQQKIVVFNRSDLTTIAELDSPSSPANWLAKTIQDNHKQGDVKKILVKIAQGSSLFLNKEQQDWNIHSENELYANTINQVTSLKHYLEEKNCKSKISGIFWLQGESDTYKEDYSIDYKENFSNLISSFKQNFTENNIPIFTAAINAERLYLPHDKWLNYRENVNLGLQLVALKETHSVYYDGTFDDLKYTDGVHYTSESQKIIAERAYELLFKFDIDHIDNVLNNETSFNIIEKEEISITELNNHLELLPPLKQIKNGVGLFEIQCKPGYKLIVNNEKNPACVSHITAEKLIIRGWGQFFRHF